jgi:4-amino-4-deoxy-L-arabinose transferase-like glycosyltransferase
MPAFSARLPAAVVPTARRLWAVHPWLLAGLWLLVQAAFLVRYHGPHFANDSAPYLEYAHNIAERGYFEPGHYRRYILYPLFESLFLRLGWGWWGIIAGQLLLAALAARALYGATHRLTPSGGRRAAALASALFILWPETQQFNAYLLTESLFISLSVLALAAFVRARRGRLSDYLLLAVLLLLCALARPNGFVIAVAAGLAGLLTLAYRPNKRLFWLMLLALGALSPVLWRLLNYQLATYTLIETYQRGDLMFLVKDWAVHSARPLALPPPGLSPVERLAYFYWHNPVVGLRLVLGKLFVFASGLKPHYSLVHRAMSVLLLWPCYWLAARAARQRLVWRPARLLLVLVPVLQAGIVMLTVDDYDVRFLAPVLPFVFVLAGLQVARVTTGSGQIKQAVG